MGAGPSALGGARSSLRKGMRPTVSAGRVCLHLGLFCGTIGHRMRGRGPQASFWKGARDARSVRELLRRNVVLRLRKAINAGRKLLFRRGLATPGAFANCFAALCIETAESHKRGPQASFWKKPRDARSVREVSPAGSGDAAQWAASITDRRGSGDQALNGAHWAPAPPKGGGETWLPLRGSCRR